MANPGSDFINQAISEVIAVLEASPLFMSHLANHAPAGAEGSIVCVEADLPETTTIRQDKLPHASVVYLKHEATDDGTISSQDYKIEIGIRLYHRGSDRPSVWGAIQKAAAAISSIVDLENTSGQFGGFAQLAWDRGGTAIDTQEATGYGAMLLTGINLQITHIPA